MVDETIVADDVVCDSSASVVGALRSHPGAGDGDVYNWGIADIWDNHQLYDVLPGGAGFLRCMKHVGGGVLVRMARWNMYTGAPYIGPGGQFGTSDLWPSARSGRVGR